MVKHTALSLVLLVVYLNSWLPLDTFYVSVLAVPTAEYAQSILSTIAEANGEGAAKGVFLPGKAREEIAIARALEDYLPGVNENEKDEDAFYYDGGDIDKRRRLRAIKRRFGGSERFFNEEKRRLRFVKRQDSADDKGAGLAPRLRFNELQSFD